MDPKAVDQAKARLLRAEAALEQLRGLYTFREQMSAWTDFLLAASTIYTKLEQGAKISGASTGWFGRKKHERRTDSLLRYLHFARNTDEHGLEPIAEHQGTAYGFNDEAEGRSFVVNPWGKPPGVYPLDNGPPIVPAHTHDRVKLVKVTDSRFHDSAEPPSEFLGTRLKGQTPLYVAEAALPYLRELVAEAENLAG